MVNLYQLLGIGMHASAGEIQQAIATQRELGQVNPEVLDKAEAWLLDAGTRGRYDAQLRASDANVDGEAVLGLTEPISRLGEPTVMLAKPATMQQSPKATRTPQPESGLLEQATYYEALAGPNKADYYLNQFERIERTGKGGFNWAAFFGGGYWYCARGMWQIGLASVCAPLLVLVLVSVCTLLLGTLGGVVGVLVAVVWLLWRFLWLPGRANQQYLRFANQRIAQLQFKYAKQPERLLRLLRGSTNVGAGIAIGVCMGCLMWPMVVGIIAAISLPAYQNHANQANYALAYDELSALKPQIDTHIVQYGKAQNGNPAGLGYVNVSAVTHLQAVEMQFDAVGEGQVMGRDLKNYNIEMRLLRDSAGLWQCEIGNSGSNPLRVQDFPTECRVKK